MQEARNGGEGRVAGGHAVVAMAASRKTLPAGGRAEVGVAQRAARQAWRRAALHRGGRSRRALGGRLGAWSPCTLGNTGSCGPALGRSMARGWTACGGFSGRASGDVPSFGPQVLRLDRLRRWRRRRRFFRRLEGQWCTRGRVLACADAAKTTFRVGVMAAHTQVAAASKEKVAASVDKAMHTEGGRAARALARYGWGGMAIEADVGGCGPGRK